MQNPSCGPRLHHSEAAAAAGAKSYLPSPNDITTIRTTRTCRCPSNGTQAVHAPWRPVRLRAPSGSARAGRGPSNDACSSGAEPLRWRAGRTWPLRRRLVPALASPPSPHQPWRWREIGCFASAKSGFRPNAIKFLGFARLPAPTIALPLKCPEVRIHC